MLNQFPKYWTNIDFLPQPVCAVVNSLVLSSATPDLILDTTLFGPLTDVIHQLSYTAAIPTLSMAYKEHGFVYCLMSLVPHNLKFFLSSSLLPILID